MRPANYIGCNRRAAKHGGYRVDFGLCTPLQDDLASSGALPAAAVYALKYNKNCFGGYGKK